MSGARLIGRVENIKPELMRSAATVVPLRAGGGTRLKILEALAMECPIVTTTLGAEGLDVVDGRDVLIADTATAFASPWCASLATRSLPPASRVRAGARLSGSMTGATSWIAPMKRSDPRRGSSGMTVSRGKEAGRCIPGSVWRR